MQPRVNWAALPTECDECECKSHTDCGPRCSCDGCKAGDPPSRTFGCGRQFELATGRACGHCVNAPRPPTSTRSSPWFVPFVLGAALAFAASGALQISVEANCSRTSKTYALQSAQDVAAVAVAQAAAVAADMRANTLSARLSAAGREAQTARAHAAWYEQREKEYDKAFHEIAVFIASGAPGKYMPDDVARTLKIKNVSPKLRASTK